MTPVSFTQARDVNRAVNDSSRFASDVERYGKPEFWTEIDGAGDCEDYALGKRAALLATGADSETLRLAICVTETGESHAVLIVTTSDGDYVLDNRHSEPMARQDLPYSFRLIQEGAKWHVLA